MGPHRWGPHGGPIAHPLRGGGLSLKKPRGGGFGRQKPRGFVGDLGILAGLRKWICLILTSAYISLKLKDSLFKVVRQRKSHSYEHIYILGYFCALTYLENGQ